jgi:hypothetical protein
MSGYCVDRRWSAVRPMHHGARAGFALESVLLLLVVFGALVGAAAMAASAFARTSGIDARAVRTAYAAEGGGDQIMAQLDAAMADGAITEADVTAITAPVLPGYTVTQETRTDGAPTFRTITRGTYAGLYALEQPMRVLVTARDSIGDKATIEMGVTAQSIPIFQFGVFYDRDLEINNGPPMTFAGWVHSNGGLYLSTNSADYREQVTAADSVFWGRKDKNERLSGVRIANAAGSMVALDFDSRSHTGAAFVARSNLRFNGRLKSAQSGVRPLRLPLPITMNPIEVIRPAQPGDTPDIQQTRMANKADLRFVVTLTDSLGGASFAVAVQQARTGGRTVLSSADLSNIFSFGRNRFWDRRENKQVDVLDVDIEKLRAWVAGAPGTRQVSVFYIEFRGANAADPLRDYPAVRLINGWELPPSTGPGDPGGLTVSTNVHMYVRGNYNSSVNWRPAAFIADAITFQSNGWSDALSNAKRTVTGPMTVYAAIMAGNTETPCDWRRCGGAQPYGGGLENFPRFLENWSGQAFNYWGSLVSLYSSSQSTGPWTGGPLGSYYDPPNRNWNFETRFRNPALLPPGTPRLGSVLQIAFRSVY